jgi:thymidylate kinase
MNQHNIYFISGVSGVGKTSTLEQLKRLLLANIFDVRDFDERGVPDGGGPEWHDNETRHWLDVALLNALNGKSTIISGFTNPEEFKNIHNPKRDIPAHIILLDASPDILRKRLYARHATPESKREIERSAGVSLDKFVEQCVSFAPKLNFIFTQNNFPIVNTDNKTPGEVAGEVVNLMTLNT